MLRIVLLIFLCTFASLFGRAENESILLKGSINKKSATFVFDTGMPLRCVLVENTVGRFKLAVTKFETEEDALVGAYGLTERCTLEFQHQSVNGQFPVLRSPPPFASFPADGVIGWASVSNLILKIDAKAGRVELLQTVPGYAKDWLRLPIETDSHYLRLIVPTPSERTAVLSVDTGDGLGVELRPDLWETWKINHANQPMALESGFNYSDGIVVAEEMWANKVVFGPLTLTDLPISEASPLNVRLGGNNFEATLGLAALRRLDLIVDRKHGFAYVRAKNEKGTVYKTDRLAAAFIPRDEKCTEFVAYVLTNGPAYLAGVRNGDVLEAIDGQKIHSADEYRAANKRFNGLPSGAKVRLSLRRGTNVFDASIVLRDILRP